MEQPGNLISKFWAAVRENPADFNSWTFLLQTVDAEDISAIREAYNAFLSEYPLCYVYWKKFADFEHLRGDPETVRTVYERGVAAIPYSVDLWVHYCNFLVEKSTEPADTRSVFERALAYVGSDYLSAPFWDKYLEFETNNKEFTNVGALYTRLLGLPIEGISKYYDRWRTFASTHSITELLTEEEKLEWETDDETVKREKMNAAREHLYNLAIAELAKRQSFEQVIKDRPYFHVKPLLENELKTWHAYLTFEEKQGDYVKTMKLYERCLITCCNYPQFWRRYCSFLEQNVGVEQARAVWVRATSVFLKRRPDVHLDYAMFEEAQGETEKAKDIYTHALDLAPSHVESVLRWAEFNRRHKDIEAACNILSQAIASSQFETAAAFLAMNLARMQERFLGDVTAARATYQEAIAKTPDNKHIWLAAINFETAHTTVSQDKGQDVDAEATGVDRVLELYARAVSEDSKLSKEDRLELWRNYIDFAQAFLNEPQRIHKLKVELCKAFPRGRAKESKKRALEEATPSKSKLKYAKTISDVSAPAASTSAMAAPILPTPMTVSVPTATAQYGVPPQGYGAMYAQYGAYPGYGAYPTSATPAAGWPVQQPTATVYPGSATGQYAYSYQQPPYSMDAGY